MEVKSINADDNFNLYVQFSDGSTKKINIKTFLLSTSPDAIKVKTDLSTFKKVYIEDGVAISWPNLNVSLDPEGIYEAGEDVKMSVASKKILLQALKKFNT